MSPIYSSLLISKGYHHYDTCGCGGTRTYKYKRSGGKEVWVKPKKNKYLVYSQSHMIETGSLHQIHLSDVI